MDMSTIAMSLQLLVTTTLLVVAWQDWIQRRISNHAVLLLIGLASLHWACGLGNLNALWINLVLVLMVSLPGALKSTLGAGDIKLLFTLALLWPTNTLLQAFSVGVIGLVLLCVAMDRLLGDYSRATGEGACLPSVTFIEQLNHRGLPLGTALAIGYLTTLI